MDYMCAELQRCYHIEYDRGYYTRLRDKISNIVEVLVKLELFICKGLFLCIELFLFNFTFLPIRFMLALSALITSRVMRLFSHNPVGDEKKMSTSEIIDLLKGFMFIVCVFVLRSWVDVAWLYHLFKTTSLFKLYFYFNVLEVAEKVVSYFEPGLYNILYLNATETKTDRLYLLSYVIGCVLYMLVHTFFILCQATVLNVTINSNNTFNKNLLPILVTNYFSEIKSTVLKKFDKEAVFKMSSTDTRKIFHLSILLLVVVVQTMDQCRGDYKRLESLLWDCSKVLGGKFIIDFAKYLCVLIFNEIPANVYNEFTTRLTGNQVKHSGASSERSEPLDLATHLLGFEPLPLTILAAFIISTVVHIQSFWTALQVVLIMLILFLLRKICQMVLRTEKLTK